MARMNVLADIAKGLKANVHAVENFSPVSRVAIYVKAGSRYEPDHLPGISHYLRASAGLTTQNSSVWGIPRHMERNGATFRVTSDREYIVYQVTCLRDKLGNVLSFIDDTLHQPEFRPWELVDYVQPRLKEELGRLKKSQSIVANEALHKAAFRGGLAHSTIIPEHQVEKFKRDDVLEFFENNYVLDRMSFVGLGVNQEELSSTINERFSLNGAEYKGVSGQSRYVGGEARIQAGFPQTLVNFVVQGRPIGDLRDLAALEVIASIIGDSRNTPIKYGQGLERSLPGALRFISPEFRSNIININHLDTGLFGFSIQGPNEHLKRATKMAVKHVRQVLSSLNETDLKNAKQVAKARSLIQGENHSLVFDALGRRHAAGITGQAPLDQVEKLTLKEVQSVASTLLKSKPTLVAIGNPRFVPYVDELD